MIIAIDWSGYPFNQYYILQASHVCDGRIILLMSQTVPVEKKNNIMRAGGFQNYYRLNAYANTYISGLSQKVRDKTSKKIDYL